MTGTPVGCACGDGVLDWARIIEICKRAPRDICFSVECGSIDHAVNGARKPQLHVLRRVLFDNAADFTHRNRIEGQQSGDVGELAGFNSKKVFIRPSGNEDRFENPYPVFTKGAVDGWVK